MSIGKIKNLLVEINLLKRKEFHMKYDNRYKCENYDIYKEEYNEVYNKLIDTRKLFVDECNNFVDYPKTKFLFFDTTKKIKLEEEKYIGLLLEVPFIDKQEYFCLINLFESMPDYIKQFRKFYNSGDTEWMFE